MAEELFEEEAQPVQQPSSELASLLLKVSKNGLVDAVEDLSGSLKKAQRKTVLLETELEQAHALEDTLLKKIALLERQLVQEKERAAVAEKERVQAEAVAKKTATELKRSLVKSNTAEKQFLFDLKKERADLKKSIASAVSMMPAGHGVDCIKRINEEQFEKVVRSFQQENLQLIAEIKAMEVEKKTSTPVATRTPTTKGVSPVAAAVAGDKMTNRDASKMRIEIGMLREEVKIKESQLGLKSDMIRYIVNDENEQQQTKAVPLLASSLAPPPHDELDDFFAALSPIKK